MAASLSNGKILFSELKCLKFCSLSHSIRLRNVSLNHIRFARRLARAKVISHQETNQDSGLIDDSGKRADDISKKNNEFTDDKFPDSSSVNKVRNRESDVSRKGEDKRPDQKVIVRSFGNIRFDAHNVTKYHGQYEDTISDIGKQHIKPVNSLRVSRKGVVSTSTDNTQRKLMNHSERLQNVKLSQKEFESEVFNIKDSNPGDFLEWNLSENVCKPEDTFLNLSPSVNIEDDLTLLNAKEVIRSPNSLQKGGSSKVYDTSLNSVSNFIDEQYFGEMYSDTAGKDTHSKISENPNFKNSDITINNNNSSYIDEQYFMEKYAEPFQTDTNCINLNNDIITPSVKSENTESSHLTTGNENSGRSSFIDEQFFMEKYDESFNTHSDYKESNVNASEVLNKHDRYLKLHNTTSKNNQHLIDEQYFSNLVSYDYDQSTEVSRTNEDFNASSSLPPMSHTQGQRKTSMKEQAKNSQVNLNRDTTKIKKNNALKTNPDFQEKRVPRTALNEHDEKFSTSKNFEHPDQMLKPKKDETAYDYIQRKRKAEKLRIKTDKNGSQGSPSPEMQLQGHKVQKSLVQDLRHIPRDIVLHMLKCSIIYDSDGIVAFNKPFGLAVHGDESKVLGRSLSTFLQELALYVDPQNPDAKLYPVHRLDRDTTGVHLFAKTQELARKLHEMFKQREILKTYWAITKGVPDPREGLISIPMMEGRVDNKQRMVLCPDLSGDAKSLSRSQRFASEAITYYKTLQFVDNAALVEVKPETGVKHQIRAHLGLGLTCSVLGDHKYSYLRKLVPQTLPGDMLRKLNIRQTKARDIPLHLHAKEIVIPKITDGRDVVLKAPLPNHFVQNLKALGFRKNK